MTTYTTNNKRTRQNAFKSLFLCGVFLLLFLFGIFGSARALDQFSFGSHAGTASVAFPGDYFDFGIVDSFSIEGWFKFDNNNAYYSIIGKQVFVYPDYRGYAIDTYPAGTMRIVFAAYNNVWIVASAPTTIPLNQWLHVVLTYDGCGVASCLHLFWDGIEQDLSITANSLGGNDFKYSPAGLNFPHEKVAHQRQPMSSDAVRIWDYALSAGEISALYNNGNGVCVGEESYGYSGYNLDEGAGTDILDAIGNRDGVIAGTNWLWDGNKVICELPLPTLTDGYISINTPTENEIIYTNQVEVSGECKYPNVEIQAIGEYLTMNAGTNCAYQLPYKDARYYFIQEILVDGYTTSTGRTAGYAKVYKDPNDFAGIVKYDVSDIRVYRYDGDFEQFYDGGENIDLPWWYDSGYLTFPVKQEQATGYPYPKYRYYIEYSFEFENRPPTIQANPPPAFDFSSTLSTEYTIKGDYSILLSPVESGSWTANARTYISSPQYIYSDWTADRNFSVQYEAEPIYLWEDLTILYQDISVFALPSKFLQNIFDGLEGLLPPLMGFVNSFNQFFDRQQAIEYATTIIDNFKKFISYTKLFDEIIGGYPLTAGLTLLIFVYIAIISINQISKLINLVKP